MSQLEDLPELGVGLIYWPSMEGLIEGQPIDLLEVEPQPFWFPDPGNDGSYILDRRVFDHLRSLPVPKLAHGVGFPIAGTVGPEPKQVSAFIESIEVLDAPWASEHLSFSRVRDGDAEFDAGFLLPPIQSPEGVSLAARNIRGLTEQLPVRLAFETGVSYLQPLPGELTDGQFFGAVAQEADCGILLDLHNVWANERNGRQPVLELVDELPLDRVIELHLAGGQEFEGYWVDAHSGLVSPALMDLARQVVPLLPHLKAIIFEVMPQYVVAQGIDRSQLSDQFLELQKLWSLRGTSAEPKVAPVPTQQATGNVATLPTPSEWEDAIAAAVTNHHASALPLAGELATDGGTSVLRTLISAARAGKLADTLTLTTRLLLLTVGEKRLDDILEAFWSTVPSSQMAADEATEFVDFLLASGLRADVPYLDDVTGFELAAHRSIMTGHDQTVAFSVDPGPVIAALRAGRVPPALPTESVQLTVAAPQWQGTA